YPDILIVILGTQLDGLGRKASFNRSAEE
ncbi:hypothetical protein OOU_Y34scaffold00865g2, partial [Pyricularia oryzae Y34]